MSGILKAQSVNYNGNYDELIKDYSFSRGTLDSLKQNKNISTATLNEKEIFCQSVVIKGSSS